MDIVTARLIVLGIQLLMLAVQMVCFIITIHTLRKTKRNYKNSVSALKMVNEVLELTDIFLDDVVKQQGLTSEEN